MSVSGHLRVSSVLTDFDKTCACVCVCIAMFKPLELKIFGRGKYTEVGLLL
jgi:hypothetical protein